MEIRISQMMNLLQILFAEHMIRMNRCLSVEDIARLKGMEAIYESNQGKLLARSDEDGSLILVECTGNDELISENAMFKSPYTNPVDIRRKSIVRFLELFESCDIFWLYPTYLVTEVVPKLLKLATKRGNMKLSNELSDFLWRSDEHDVILVQFKSPVPQLPPLGQLKVVFNKIESHSSGEYYLAACNDGTVKWFQDSECENKGHVWRVHLFERRRDEQVNLSQKLRRRMPIALYNYFLNVINNNNFGGNRNENGTQIIGDITVRQFFNLV